MALKKAKRQTKRQPKNYKLLIEIGVVAVVILFAYYFLGLGDTVGQAYSAELGKDCSVLSRECESGVAQLQELCETWTQQFGGSDDTISCADIFGLHALRCQEVRSECELSTEQQAVIQPDSQQGAPYDYRQQQGYPPTYEQPQYEQPASGQGAPAQPTPSYQQPQYQQPASGSDQMPSSQPSSPASGSYQQPSYQQDQQQGYTQPSSSYQQPTYQQGTPSQPGYTQPSQPSYQQPASGQGAPTQPSYTQQPSQDYPQQPTSQQAGGYQGYQQGAGSCTPGDVRPVDQCTSACVSFELCVSGQWVLQP